MVLETDTFKFGTWNKLYAQGFTVNEIAEWTLCTVDEVQEFFDKQEYAT